MGIRSPRTSRETRTAQRGGFVLALAFTQSAIADDARSVSVGVGSPSFLSSVLTGGGLQIPQALTRRKERNHATRILRSDRIARRDRALLRRARVRR